jgi:uncharacterized pyridoxal phosphate-containing UPF0001 family protein
MLACSEFSNLKLNGLMLIAPTNIRQAEQSFELTQQVYDTYKYLGLNTLSMGMSDDFAIAIKYGSTMVRIGRALFGDRV